MKSLGENTFVKVACFSTRILWYLFLAIAAVMFAGLLLGYAGQLPEGWSPVVNIPVDTSLASLNDNPVSKAVYLTDASASVEFSYLAQHYPGTYLSLSMAITLFICFFLFGFYQLKKLLESTVNDAVFTRQNIRRIKIIAVLVFLIDPLAWLFREFILVVPEFLAGPNSEAVNITLSLDAGYWFIGLLLFVLAAVFEKGYEMYQELKLTV